MKILAFCRLGMMSVATVCLMCGAGVESCERRLQAEQPVSLRMFKYLDFVSAFDAVYMHAVAMDELDALPDGFVRAWEAIKSGREVIDLKDLIVALPILYHQLLVARSPVVPDDSCDHLVSLQERLFEVERGLIEVMFDFERRLSLLEKDR